VTFTNSFAIEGITSTFRPVRTMAVDETAGVYRRPRPLPDRRRHHEAMVEATAESARQAEQEWQRAVPAQRGKVFFQHTRRQRKPVVGGVENRRFATSHGAPTERFLLRAKLYQAAVDLLASKGAQPI